MVPNEKLNMLKDLRKRIRNCHACKLREYYDNPVPCAGSPTAEIMFIGEAPGAEETEQGKPFVGASGKILREAIIEAGLSVDNVFITNVLCCRPLNNKFPDNMEYINACQSFLQEQFLLIQPKIVISIGGKAHKYVRKSDIGITKICGKWEEYNFSFNNNGLTNHRALYMATLHPSFCLRGPDTRYPNEIMQLDSEGKKNLFKKHIASITSQLQKININQ